MKQSARSLAEKYSNDYEKMNYTQLNYFLEMNGITQEEFLKELNAVEWNKTFKVFKFWVGLCIIVTLVCRLIVVS